MEVGGLKNICSEFVDSLWGPLSSSVDRGMIGNDSFIACTCVVLLDSNFLLVNSGGIDNKFVNHYIIRRNLSLSSPQLVFPRVLFFATILLVVLGQYILRSKL